MSDSSQATENTAAPSAEVISSPAESKAESGSKFEKMVEHSISVNRGEPIQEEKSEPAEKSQESGETQNDWEKNYKNVQAEKDKILSQNEKIARAAISKNPEYIHDLAEIDRTLVDRIIKAELGKEGISTYDQLLALREKQEKVNELDEPSKEVYEKMVKPLEEKLSVIEQKELDRQKAEADMYLARFREERNDFEGDLEKECWDLFQKSSLSLEEVYDYVKFKKGHTADLGKAEERAYKKMAQAQMAGSLPASGSKSSNKQSNKKTYSSKELDFLNAMGVKK